MAMRLSPRGRQSFGAWTANTFRFAAGGLFGLMVVPGFLGHSIPFWATIIAAVLGIALAIAGILIYNMSAERIDETSIPGTSDG